MIEHSVTPPPMFLLQQVSIIIIVALVIKHSQFHKQLHVHKFIGVTQKYKKMGEIQPQQRENNKDHLGFKHDSASIFMFNMFFCLECPDLSHFFDPFLTCLKLLFDVLKRTTNYLRTFYVSKEMF